MKSKINGIFLCLLGVGAGFSLSAWNVQAQNTEDALNPKIVRSQDNGWVYYQRIALKNASFQFIENENRLMCNGNFVDYEFSKDERSNLTQFRLNLSSRPEMSFRSTPGRAALIPVSNSTSYRDLNGDSVLDTINKSGPQGSGSYILVKDAWIEVEVKHFKLRLPEEKSRTAKQTGTQYVFGKNGWEIKSIDAK